MLEPAVAASAIQAAITIAAILLVWRFAMVPLFSEVFRQRVFRLRRELFLKRVDGLVSAEDPAYQMLMRRMNGTIRFAESITYGRLLLVAIFSAPKLEKLESDGFEEAIQASPSKELLKKCTMNLSYEIVRHIAMSSPLAWFFGIIAIPFMVLAIPFLMAGAVKNWLWNIGHRLAKRPVIARIQAGASMMLSDDRALDFSLAA